MESVENKSIKERLKQFIMLKNISVREFERQIGVSYGFLGNMSNSTSPQRIAKISHCFPELNVEWLLTGEGEMLRKDQTQNISGHHNTATMNGDITQNYSGDINAMLVNEISEHRRIISKSQEQIDKSQAQIDELIGIIKELTGKIQVANG